MLMGALSITEGRLGERLNISWTAKNGINAEINALGGAILPLQENFGLDSNLI